MILRDPYALHRKWWDVEWTAEPGDTEWTEWDYTLAEVYQVIEDFTDPESGQFMPYDQSGIVRWEVRSVYSGALEAIERARESRKELKPGEKLYAVPVFDTPDQKPTLDDWIKDINSNKADRRPPEAYDSRPPTPEELLALRDLEKSRVE